MPSSAILRGMPLIFDPVAHTIAPDAFDEAAALVAGRVHRTPLLTSRTAARVVESASGVRLAGGTLHAKAEHLQVDRLVQGSRRDAPARDCSTPRRRPRA